MCLGEPRKATDITDLHDVVVSASLSACSCESPVSCLSPGVVSSSPSSACCSMPSVPACSCFNFQPCSVTNSACYTVNSIPACSCSNVRACSSSFSACFSNCTPACCTINVLSTNPICSVVEGVVPKASSISDGCSNVNNTMNSENSTVDSSTPLTVQRTIFENKIQKLVNEKDKALLELSDVKNENMVLKKQLELSNMKFNDLSKQFNSHLVENSKKYMEVMGETNDLLKLRPKESKTKPSNYIHVPSYTKSLSECNSRTVGERSAKLLSFLSVMSNNSEKDMILTLTHFFNSNSNISLKSYQSSNLDSINHKLTPEAFVDLKLLLNIPM